MADPSAGRRRRWGIGSRRAVSIYEVLIVIAIVVLLLAILIPSVGYVREQMRRIVCSNNLAQWGIATQCYREDSHDHIPTEGKYWDINEPGTWFNTLPSYLGLPAYKDLERIDKQIKELPALHVWICPSKNLTPAYKSGSGMNQFHYGMNQVLDGLGKPPDGSKDTPGFPDKGKRPLRAHRFSRYANTVLLFDISPNSPAGTQRQVATIYQRDYQGARVGRFHGDYANILYLNGRVANCTTDELVTEHDFQNGDMIWTNPKLYWGWMPSRQ